MPEIIRGHRIVLTLYDLGLNTINGLKSKNIDNQYINKVLIAFSNGLGRGSAVPKYREYLLHFLMIFKQKKAMNFHSNLLVVGECSPEASGEPTIFSNDFHTKKKP
ncbi:hypothetical protein GIHI108528_00015 [Gillisia hiemivivida]